MKAAFTVVAIGVSLAAAQELSSLPPCGQTCIGNMLALAPSLGCDGADAACLCRTADFGYGVRDCANQACGDAAAAQQVIAYGTQYCSSALANGDSDSASGSSVLGGAAGASGTGASASQTDGGESNSASAITTSALTALVSGTDSSFITTTGFTTIFDTSSGPAATGTNSAGELTDSAGSVIASATESASAAASSAEESATSAINSASESASNAASSAAGAASSATSEAGAAVMTAAPVLAAGVLALLAL